MKKPGYYSSGEFARMANVTLRTIRYYDKQNILKPSYVSDSGVPIISILVGEGGSGGALGLAVSDEVWMLENAVYSVISPEGCASILWKDASKTKEAAQCLKLTAEELLNLKVVERAIREPKDPKEGFDKLYLRLKKDLYSALTQGKRLSPQELTERRYQRFRRMGAIEE